MLDYNTKKGLLKATESLPLLVETIEERRRAGYERKERLDEFVVLGRLLLDTIGNCMIALNFKADKKIEGLPQVLTKEEFSEEVQKYDEANNPDRIRVEEMRSPSFDWEANKKRPLPISLSFSAQRCLPNPKVFCPVCGRGWGIENIFDFEIQGKYENYSFPEFAGKTLGEIKTEYARLTDAEYHVPQETQIQNDQYVDLTPYDQAHPDWPKNKKGWIGEKEGVLGLYGIPVVDHPNPLLLALLVVSVVSPFIGLGTYINLKLRDYEDNKKQ